MNAFPLRNWPPQPESNEVLRSAVVVRAASAVSEVRFAEVLVIGFVFIKFSFFCPLNSSLLGVIAPSCVGKNAAGEIEEMVFKAEFMMVGNMPR